MKWIKITEELPKHLELVLVSTTIGYYVVIFVDSKTMNEEIKKTGYPGDLADIQKDPFYFVSQEVEGRVLKAVRHWMRLPEYIED